MAPAQKDPLRKLQAEAYLSVLRAVAASEQVRGFGTRLMNHTKAFATARDGLSCFLTYADNNAVGYFAKQGFTKKVTAPRSRWHG